MNHWRRICAFQEYHRYEQEQNQKDTTYHIQFSLKKFFNVVIIFNVVTSPPDQPTSPLVSPAIPTKNSHYHLGLQSFFHDICSLFPGVSNQSFRAFPALLTKLKDYQGLHIVENTNSNSQLLNNFQKKYPKNLVLRLYQLQDENTNFG